MCGSIPQPTTDIDLVNIIIDWKNKIPLLKDNIKIQKFADHGEVLIGEAVYATIEPNRVEFGSSRFHPERCVILYACEPDFFDKLLREFSRLDAYRIDAYWTPNCRYLSF
jgi:hypothetical protein